MMIHYKSFHLKEKPFKCNECQQTFAHKHTLEKHLAKGHGPVQKKVKTSTLPSVAGCLTGMDYIQCNDYACPMDCCDYRFKRQYDVYRHCQAVHEIEG
jgi:uncharacterized C2H2 Zn-finger protein